MKDKVILVIDDDASARESLFDYLEDYDYHVLSAENGRVGLEIFEREMPDLVLTDLRMPEMDGLEVLGQIRKSAPETPIIVVSGMGVIGDVVEALHLGAWDYLLKPIEDLSMVTHAIEKAMERVRLRRENRKYQEHLETLVKERTRKLEESEQKFRIIFEQAGDSVVLINRETEKIVEFNDVACQNLGYSRREFAKLTIQDMKIVDSLGNSKELRKLTANADQFEIKLRSKTGEPHHFIVKVRSISLDEKNYSLCICHDITERKRLERQLRQAQKMEALGTLAGGIAHDFNNILSAVIGFTEMTLDEECNRDEIRQNLTEVLEAGERAKSLIDQILAFSRQSEKNLHPIQIKQIVKEVLKLLRATLPAMIEIREEIRSEDYVLADPTQIHQVIMNLCTNAAQAMREKGGTLKVQIDTVRVGPEIIFRHQSLKAGLHLKMTISDTGVGIHADIIDRIFDPFFTTKEKGEGTGMGLSVVHGIVDGHKGAIAVESKPGQGATFIIFLPVSERQPYSHAGQQSPPKKGTGKILFVDDEMPLLLLGRKQLHKLGYEVITAISGFAALKLFKTSPKRFDAVITDMAMPKMTGYQLAEQLLQINPRIPIILCTGYSITVDKEKALSAGICAFLHKPILGHVLAETLQKALSKT